MAREFIWSVRVYYEDTDAGGVVYHANYLRFMERARSECLRDMGTPVTQIAERDKCLFVVRSLEMNFRRPAILDDELLVSAKIVIMKKASMKIAQEVRRKVNKGHEVLVQAVVELAMVSSDTFRPAAVPDCINEAFKQNNNMKQKNE